MGSDFPEERRIERLRERLLLDIVRSKMAKDAWFHISLRIDMKVFPPCSNASLGQTAIVPKVNEEHGFRGPKIGEPFPRPASLFRGHHEREIGVPSDGDIMEGPEKNASFLHQKIDKSITRQDIMIL
jgi:hypothetical protein